MRTADPPAAMAESDKVCSRCSERKPSSEFTPRIRGIPESGYCRSCTRPVKHPHWQCPGGGEIMYYLDGVRSGCGPRWCMVNCSEVVHDLAAAGARSHYAHHRGDRCFVAALVANPQQLEGYPDPDLSFDHEPR